MTTDAGAERFLEQDLSDLDFSQFKRVHFEFEEKNAQVSMRMPRSLLDAVKARARAPAKARGIAYHRYVRQMLEKVLHDTND